MGDNNIDDKRKPLSERLSERIFKRVHQGIGQASMCWEHPENAGVFDANAAGNIALELCHFIADEIEKPIINIAINVSGDMRELTIDEMESYISNTIKRLME